MRRKVVDVVVVGSVCTAESEAFSDCKFYEQKQRGRKREREAVVYFSIKLIGTGGERLSKPACTNVHESK